MFQRAAEKGAGEQRHINRGPAWGRVNMCPEWKLAPLNSPFSSLLTTLDERMQYIVFKDTEEIQGQISALTYKEAFFFFIEKSM